MTDFSNKIIVVTGSSSGIGLEIGLAALETGAKVIFCSRNIEKNIPKILSDKRIYMSGILMWLMNRL